ncbi:MAG: ABC transporter ATP-binding protein [Bacteroidota bacterium]|nr:ABC transporter ATP-binding protein [Bacteroidota bacterium]
MNSGEIIISVEELTKVYDMGEVKVHALRGVNMNIQDGEFVAIMGHSGSGKSTLMNIIGCLDLPTSGEYLLDGENVKKMNKDQLARLRNRKIGFVFQTFNLLARTSALENIELPLLYNPELKVKERKEKAMNALEMVGLADWQHHYPNQLSGGQQQRIAIARSLVNDPVIILADEPTGNLDTRTSFEVMEIFQELNSRGITIALVTHEADISQFAARNVMFRDGRIFKEKLVTKIKNAKAELNALPEEDDIF